MSTHVKHRIQGKGPDVKAAGCRKSERLKELAAGNMSARVTSADVMKLKSLEVDPLVSHWRMLKKKFILARMEMESLGTDVPENRHRLWKPRHRLWKPHAEKVAIYRKSEEIMSTLLKLKIQGKGPDVKAAGCRKSEILRKKHDDQIPKMQGICLHMSVGVKHRIQGKGSDVKAVGIRKSERLRKKHDDQIPKELAADKMKKKSDVDQKTCYDGFLGKEVPVIEGQELGGGCAVCGAWDHFHIDCPCLKYFPKGTEIGVHYETMCRGCDRIGEVCCKEGGFALMKVCAYCCGDGHWQWEDCEDCSRPKDLVFEKPEFFYKMEDGEPIPMWLRT